MVTPSKNSIHFLRTMGLFSFWYPECPDPLTSTNLTGQLSDCTTFSWKNRKFANLENIFKKWKTRNNIVTKLPLNVTCEYQWIQTQNKIMSPHSNIDVAHLRHAFWFFFFLCISATLTPWHDHRSEKNLS